VKRYFAYIRVSTIKQGEKGVSLSEQREIVERYAVQQGLTISQWFEERETASKIGRPLFNQMLAALKSHRADGVIIHKVDRSARNRWDWAEVMQLRDFGIDVHFAGESLDLSTPSGILAADIQAVMAVHYSRNLSEETKKGYYGRLKQGLSPFPAPLGYLNNGRGKLKTIDPMLGPIVKEAFELYATGRYSLTRLVEEMYSRGLRTRATQKYPGGERVGRSAIAAMLSNPFYIGVLHVNKVNRTFLGNHEPLISRELFERVQEALTGKTQRRVVKHTFHFSRLIYCAFCGRALVGETHKGHIYYRCHSTHATVSLREDFIEDQFARMFLKLQLSEEESSLIDLLFAETKQNWDQHMREARRSEELRVAAIDEKLQRLTDAYIDGMLDKANLEERKTTLLLERREAERRISGIGSGGEGELSQWEKNVELIKAAYLLYEIGNWEEKCELVKSVMSNRVASHKTVDFTLRFPFSEVAKRPAVQSGCPLRTTGRKFWRKLMKAIGGPAQNGTAWKQPLSA
jgi:site-specific DNA recombinase